MKKISKNIKRVFFKDGVDFNDTSVNLYNFHPQLRFVLIFQGIFFNHSESKLRFTWPVFCVIDILVCTVLEVIFTIHGIQVADYGFATECFCHTMIIIIVPFIHTSALFHSKVIIKMVYDMNEDFSLITKISAEHRKVFMKGQLKIWMLCLSWLVFSTSVPIFFLATPVTVLIYQSLFATQDEHMIRPMVFPTWLPKDDPYRSPNYEAFMVLEISAMLCVFTTFGVYVYLLFHFMLHYYIVMDVIILDIKNIFKGIDENVCKLPKRHYRRIKTTKVFNRRVKRIVSWHIAVLESVTNVSAIYGVPLVYQISNSSIFICVTGYKLIDDFENGTYNVLFLQMFFASILQVWIPCYLGTIIRNKAFGIAEACWKCGWSETPLGIMVCQDLLIIMERAQKPLHVKFLGLPNLQLETFSSIMTSAYSYFNMIRQAAHQ